MLPTILLCLISCAFINFLKLRTLKLEALLYTASHKKSVMKNILIARLMAAGLSFFSNTAAHHLVSQLYRRVLKNVLLEYLRLKYSSFMKIGLGAVQCLISHRTAAFCGFLERLAIRIVPKVILLVAMVYATLRLLKPGAVARATLLFALLAATTCGLQVGRALLRRKINWHYERSNAKRVEILESYERIVPYNTLEDEIRKYSRALERYTLFKHVFTCSTHFINLLVGLSLLYISVHIWQGTANKANFVAVVILSEDLKDAVYGVLLEVDQLIIDYANFSYSQHGKEDREGGVPAQIITAELRAKDLRVQQSGRPVFDGVSLTVRAGEKTAITGATGAGKSTLIGAVTGYVPYEGTLQIGGHEVRDLSRKTLSDLISYIPQSAKILNKSIEENLKIGRAAIDNEEMVGVCSEFSCHEIFKELGYSKIVGNRGKLLSGGQRQRVILLGSILRHSKILVFDGPFTGLDQKTERDFLTRLKEKFPEKTLLCSTQNVKLLPYFEEIIFLDGGKVYKGRYKDLIRENGEFRRFCLGGEKGESMLRAVVEKLLAPQRVVKARVR